jgi:hypothetical protein
LETRPKPWYLRQRDSRSAQQHADEAESLLAAIEPQKAALLRARLQLIRAETLALFSLPGRALELAVSAKAMPASSKRW